jgi:hypothetical protein
MASPLGASVVEGPFPGHGAVVRAALYYSKRSKQTERFHIEDFLSNFQKNPRNPGMLRCGCHYARFRTHRIEHPGGILVRSLSQNHNVPEQQRLPRFVPTSSVLWFFLFFYVPDLKLGLRNCRTKQSLTPQNRSRPGITSTRSHREPSDPTDHGHVLAMDSEVSRCVDFLDPHLHYRIAIQSKSVRTRPNLMGFPNLAPVGRPPRLGPLPRVPERVPACA